MSKETDPETQKVLRDGQELVNLIEGDGWRVARSMLIDMMNDVASIMNMEPSDNTKNIIAELEGRKIAIETIQNWFKEIDSEIANYTDNKPKLVERSDSEEIIQIEPQEDAT